MPRLTITHGPLDGQHFSFSDSVVVGRGAYCDVRLDDSTVSRRHAEIRRDEHGGWSLHDLDSANGTICDGAVVTSAVSLAASNVLVFGEVTAAFRASTSDPLRPRAKHSAAQMRARLQLLETLAALPARREDPEQLMGLALDAIMIAFENCTTIDLFTLRTGNALPQPVARRARVPSAPLPIALAQAALRAVDGICGNAETLSSSGIDMPPASALAVAIVFAGETLGCLVAESDRANTWSADDHALAKSLAGCLANLLDGLRSNRPERRVAERDLLLARRVQQHFLPQSALRIPGYRVAEAYVPARAVGGDHYEFFRYRDDRTGIIIADVSGKAVSAALVMARFGMAVRLLASQSGGPLDLLVTLNILLLDELETGMFVTAQALALTDEDGQLEIANAGHPAPLLRSSDGGVNALSLESGAPLGADARTAFRSANLTLAHGDCLLLYTDGLDEAENAQGEALGIERVIAGIGPCRDARAVLDTVNATHAAFVGSAAPTDDLTLIVISRDAAA